MVPFVTTLLSTMLPTGVFGQYSSYGEEAAKAGVCDPLVASDATTMTMPSDSAVKPASASRTVTACRRFIVNSFRLGTSRQADRGAEPRKLPFPPGLTMLQASGRCLINTDEIAPQ